MNPSRTFFCCSPLFSFLNATKHALCIMHHSPPRPSPSFATNTNLSNQMACSPAPFFKKHRAQHPLSNLPLHPTPSAKTLTDTNSGLMAFLDYMDASHKHPYTTIQLLCCTPAPHLHYNLPSPQIRLYNQRLATMTAPSYTFVLTD